MQLLFYGEAYRQRYLSAWKWSFSKSFFKLWKIWNLKNFCLAFKYSLRTQTYFRLWFVSARELKAMLHEAIFLATWNATMMNKKPSKLQRGCHTFATFFATCNMYNSKKDGGNLPRAKDELWLAHSDKIALQVAEGMLHASNLSRNFAKSRGSFYFFCNSQRNNCSCKMGCYTWIFSCKLQRNVRFVASCKKKIASCNMAFRPHPH